MRIGIDCRLSGPQHAGIGRYIENLITRLPNLAPESTWIYFVSDSPQIPSPLPKNVEVVVTPIHHYSVAEQLKLPTVFGRAKLDLLHIPHFNAPVLYLGKTVITIHDLLWHEYRGTQVTTLNPVAYWFKYLAYRMVASRAIAHAQHILVPAETIKRTLSRYYPKVAKKVTVTKEGIGPEFRQASNSKLNLTVKIPENKKLLLYVGSLYPHKNIERVLKALPQLPEYHLVIVGSRNIFQDQTRQITKNLNVASQVTFAGYLEDQQLKKLMSQAWALVQPSLSEGFGLTGVEAMAAGLPVIASQIPIFQEIYGKAASFFNPQSTESFVKAVHDIDSKRYQQLKQFGLKQVREYDWDEMVHQTIMVYQTALVKK